MPTIGKHAWSGKCAPTGGRVWNASFSVGIFEWVLTKDRQRPKRSAVKVRVYGSTSDPEAVYAKAKEIAAALDAGTYNGLKTVRV